MRLRSHLAPVADVLVPWGTGVLLALIVIDERATPTDWPWLIVGLALWGAGATLLRHRDVG